MPAWLHSTLNRSLKVKDILVSKSAEVWLCSIPCLNLPWLALEKIIISPWFRRHLSTRPNPTLLKIINLGAPKIRASKIGIHSRPIRTNPYLENLLYTKSG